MREIGKKYDTFNPFIVANEKKIPVKFIDYSQKAFGQTIFPVKNKSFCVIVLSKLVEFTAFKFFPMAHELGHIMLNHPKLENKIEKNRLEFEANFFASEICYNLYKEKTGNIATTPQELRQYGVPCEIAMFV